MLILGVDLETQGLNRETTKITEIGWALYHVDLETNRWSKKLEDSSLCYEPDYPSQPPKIVELTNITDELLILYGRPRAEVIFDSLLPAMESADLILAHRASFDRGVLQHTCKALGLILRTQPWFCTMTDIKWAAKYRCKILSHLAYDHSILVDPATLHRATDDINLMMRLVQKYNFKELLAYYEKPWVYLKADVIPPWKDDSKQVNFAKELGFTWETVPAVDDYKWPKTWVMRCKDDEVHLIVGQAEKFSSAFKVFKLEDPL